MPPALLGDELEFFKQPISEIENVVALLLVGVLDATAAESITSTNKHLKADGVEI